MESLMFNRRYGVPTSSQRIAELLLGPAGATLMLVALAASAALLLWRRADEPRTPGVRLAAIGAFLLAVRAGLRLTLFDSVGWTVPTEILPAALFGSLVLGIPCLIIGSTVGSFAASRLIETARASLESLLHGSNLAPAAKATREALIAGVLLSFGSMPAAGVASALIVGLLSGFTSALDAGLGIHLLPETRWLPQLARTAAIIAALTLIAADARASF